MNKYVKRRIKRKIYKYGNLIMYLGIFAVASVITISAVAITRTDKTVLIDKSQLAVTEKESIAMKNKDTQKVAAQGKTTQDITEKTEQESGTKVTIAVDVLNVRSQASQQSEALGIANEGETFSIISQEDEWVEIDYNGNNGFVKKEFVDIH